MPMPSQPLSVRLVAAHVSGVFGTATQSAGARERAHGPEGLRGLCRGRMAHDVLRSGGRQGRTVPDRLRVNDRGSCGLGSQGHIGR